MKPPKFNVKEFLMITLITSIWVNLSEVFRYFVFVKPRTKAFFDFKEGIAEMNWGIFSVWGAWDMLLTVMVVITFWMFATLFGNNRRTVLLAGTFSWVFLFVLFWIATANMGLANWELLLITLPLSWLEMVVASYIASKLYAKSLKTTVV